VAYNERNSNSSNSTKYLDFFFRSRVMTINFPGYHTKPRK